MGNKKRVLTTSLVTTAIVSSVIPAQALSQSSDNQNADTFSNSDRKSRNKYEPISNKLIRNSINNSNDKNSLPDTLQVSDKLISMTQKETVKINAEFNYEVKEENLKWTFGGKDISSWKTWSPDKKDYSGQEFLKIENLKINTIKDESGKLKSIVTADLNTDLLYDTVDLSPRSIRVKYPDMIGNYDLKIEDTSTNTSFKNTMKLNVYDSYRKYDELKPELDQIFKNAKSNIYLNYESIGKSVEGRDMHFVVMAKDKSSVDKYLNETVPMMLENPEQLQQKIKNKALGDYKIPIFINNIHADEAPGVDAQLDLLKKLTTQDVIKYKTLDKNNKETEVELNVKDLLDNVIFVMSITENPDGRYYNTRANANGFDLNRDNGYQTQVETLSIVEQIAKWNPVSFLDLHGFVKGFLIEPCTPPHDPNYEYDLIAKNATAQAHAMGNAGISNTKYDSYEIPFEDYDVNGGWDDATAAYTGTYALHHGAMSHTIEVPELNQDSVDAFVNAVLGASSFVLDGKDELFISQLEYYKRGVNGEDNRAADKYFVNSKGESIGRPRGNYENFFPEYYVLPVDSKLQKNIPEVQETVKYLLRNGVKVDTLDSDTKVGNTIYPKGSYVVNMHQVKRGYANLVLYDGINASDFKEMYAEIVMNFPDVRGFDNYEVRNKNVFKGKLKSVKSVEKIETKINGDSEKYIIKNSNNDAIKSINELLSKNKDVYVLAKDSKANEEGDYVVNKKDLNEISKKYTLDIEPFKDDIPTLRLREPKVYATGSYSKFVLNELGFKLVNKSEDSNIIIDDIGSANPQELKNGVDYLGIGEDSIVNVGEKVIPGLKLGKTDSYHEGLLKGEYLDDRATGGYDSEKYIYTANGSWINNVPKGVKEIAKVSNKNDFYVSGWWPNNEQVKGKTMGVTTDLEDTTLTLYANTITNKAHTKGTYRLIANAIYDSVDSELGYTSIEGNDRYETAIKLSQSKFDKADTVVIVNGNSLADGLTATPLATYKKSPILLTNGHNLSKETKYEIKRLGAKNVIIAGGNISVKDNIETELKSIGISKIERLGGANRYDTSLKIAKYIDEKCFDIKDVVITGGSGEADALSISSISASKKMPIILSQKQDINDSTYNWLKSEQLEDAYIIGGKNSVDDKVLEKVDKITAKDIKNNRIAGKDRYETNAKVLERFYGKDLDTAYVAKGKELIDALSTGPIASMDNAPVIIVGNDLNQEQVNVLNSKNAKSIVKVGGGIQNKVINKVISLLSK